MQEKELTPKQKANKARQARDKELAQALGYDSLRKFATAAHKAHEAGKLGPFLFKISSNHPPF